MATLLEDLTDIEEKAQGLVENKVANFSYTQEAYDNDDVAGVSEYNINNAQNIPTAEAETLDVNPTVLNKGYRSQASSITRMLMNHFLGRTSYNLNKSVDLFKKGFLGIKNALGKPNGLATLDENGYLDKEQTLKPYYKTPLIRDIYYEGKLCYNVEENTTNMGECWKVYSDRNITVFAMGHLVYIYDINTDTVSTINLGTIIVGVYTNLDTNTFIVVTQKDIVFLNSDFSGIERTIVVADSSSKKCYLCLNGYIFIRIDTTMYAYKIEEYINGQINFSLSTNIKFVNEIVCSSLMFVIPAEDSPQGPTVSYFYFKNKELQLQTLTKCKIFKFPYTFYVGTTGAETLYSCSLEQVDSKGDTIRIIPTFKYVRTIAYIRNPVYALTKGGVAYGNNRVKVVPINEKYFLKSFEYIDYYANGIAYSITSEPISVGGEDVGVNVTPAAFVTKNMAGFFRIDSSFGRDTACKIIDFDGVILDGANIDGMAFESNVINKKSSIEVVSTPYVNILITKTTTLQASQTGPEPSARCRTKIYVQK